MNKTTLIHELQAMIGKLSIQGISEKEYNDLIRQIRDLTDRFLEEEEKKNRLPYAYESIKELC